MTELLSKGVSYRDQLNECFERIEQAVQVPFQMKERHAKWFIKNGDFLTVCAEMSRQSKSSNFQPYTSNYAAVVTSQSATS